MKAYLIDPNTKSITEVEYNGDWRTISEFIGNDCTNFDVVGFPGGRHSIFIDDEGLIKGTLAPFFKPSWILTPLSGRGLVLGTTADGDSCDVSVSLQALQDDIEWLDVDVVVRNARRGIYDYR
jgi:hypothetical protein